MLRTSSKLEFHTRAQEPEGEKLVFGLTLAPLTHSLARTNRQQQSRYASSRLSNNFTPRSAALLPLAGLVPVTTRPEEIE
jgi:hypothetical protein